MDRPCSLPVRGCLSRNFPGWRSLLEEMLDYSERAGMHLQFSEIRDLINQNDLILAAQELRRGMQEVNFCRFLRTRFRDPTLRPKPVHKLLPSLPFAAILTTNFDKLIELAYPIGTPLYTQQDIPELADFLRDLEFTIVKLHGDVDRCQTVILLLGILREVVDSTIGGLLNFIRAAFLVRFLAP